MKNVSRELLREGEEEASQVDTTAAAPTAAGLAGGVVADVLLHARDATQHPGNDARHPVRHAVANQQHCVRARKV